MDTNVIRLNFIVHMRQVLLLNVNLFLHIYFTTETLICAKSPYQLE